MRYEDSTLWDLLREKRDLDAQLRATLHDSITAALTHAPPRPLLTHLNLDTTWLLSLPYPSSAPKPRGRRYYHVLLDPWLAGGQADVAAFFSQQWHATPSSVQSIAEVEEAIWRLEGAAAGRFDGTFEGEDAGRSGISYETEEERRRTAERKAERRSWIDLVVVSHEFTDHMHQETLLEVQRGVPVFATAKAAGIIRSWRHFDQVVDVPRFAGDWRPTSSDPLPDWIGVSRVAYDGPDLLYYHSAIMVTFTLSGPAGTTSAGDEDAAEALLYTPHGIDPGNLEALVRANPPIQTLALLHGLQDIQINTAWTSSVKAQLNKGAHNGLRVQRALNARYWIGTHDEVKRGGGIVSWFLSRKLVTLQDAIAEEQRKLEAAEGGPLDLREVRFEELGNGESLILA